MDDAQLAFLRTKLKNREYDSVAFDQLAWLAIDELRRLRASRDLSVALAQPKRHSVWIKPPCQQCGAMTADEAVSRCMGSRAEGGCHGNELWPD